VDVLLPNNPVPVLVVAGVPKAGLLPKPPEPKPLVVVFEPNPPPPPVPPKRPVPDVLALVVEPKAGVVEAPKPVEGQLTLSRELQGKKEALI
jgi:hypothetical protein